MHLRSWRRVPQCDTLIVRAEAEVGNKVLDDNQSDVGMSCDTLCVTMVVGRQYVALECGPTCFK